MTDRTAGRFVLASVALGAIVLMLGLARYGGPEGLFRRAYLEVSGRLPHPEFVPTPLSGETTAALFDSTGEDSTAWPQPGETGPATAAPVTTATAAPAATEDRSTAAVASSVLFRARPAADPAAIERDPDGQKVRLARPVRPTNTPAPTASPTPPPVTPTAEPSPAAVEAQAPSVMLTGLAHYWQTWNNCGPATLAMNLSYFGVQQGQDKVAAVLRPYKDDKNVNPEEMAAYARAQGLRALARVNGDTGLLRDLLNAGVPVLIEAWYEPEPNDGMGHYRLLVGYDDASQTWAAYDSYDSHGVQKDQPYAGIRLPYDKLDAAWKVFNRAYVAIYDESRAAAVESLIGSDMDEAAMWQRSLQSAEEAVRANEQDPFAWFNAGTSLAAVGDYDRAAQAFDQARRIRLPWRMLWYQFAPFRAYYEVSRHDEVIALADATLKTAKSVEELYYWRGMSQMAKGDVEAARASWQTALEFNPNHADAAAALAALP